MNAAAPPDIRRPRSRDAWAAILLVGLTLATFWPVLANGFVSWDDPGYVTGNSRVAGGLGASAAAWAFTTGAQGNWHPLTWLSHMIDVSLFGLDPTGHHLVSLLLHAGNVLLLFLFLRRATGATWRSALVAALFAVHPTRVESVAWIAERKDLLSALFLLLALLAWTSWVRRPRPARYAAVAVFLALALMSKPMPVTAPFLLLLLDAWPFRRFAGGEKSWGGVGRRLVLEKLPLFALAAASSVVTILVQRGGAAVQSLEQFPAGDRLANALLAWVGYVGKTFWPADLAFFYPYPRSFDGLSLALAVATLCAVSWAAITLSRRAPWLLTGWFWFAGMLVPVIGLIQVGAQSMADRYTYLPLAGLFLVVVWGAADLLSGRRVARFAAAAAAVVTILALAALARGQVRTWKDSETLFRHALAVTEDNHVAHDLLGVELLRQGRIGEAEEQLRRSIAVAPDYAPAHNNLGVALAGRGRFDEALRHYRTALELVPDYDEARNNLGVALAGLGRIDEALEQFEVARRLDPDDAEVHQNLGIAWTMRGNTARALESYLEALRLDPDLHEVAITAARILATHPDDSLRDGAVAVQLAERACGSASVPPWWLDTLAAAYAEVGRWKEAVAAAERAVRAAVAAGDTVAADGTRERLALYRERRPYRDVE